MEHFYFTKVNFISIPAISFSASCSTSISKHIWHNIYCNYCNKNKWHKRLNMFHEHFFTIHCIIIMKNFHKRSSHGHHGSKRSELAHTHMDRTYSLTHLQSTQLQPRCTKRQLSYYRIRNQICIFWRYLREGEQTGVPRKNLCQPAHWYIIGENLTSWMGIKVSNPHPPTTF